MVGGWDMGRWEVHLKRGNSMAVSRKPSMDEEITKSVQNKNSDLTWSIIVQQREI